MSADIAQLPKTVTFADTNGRIDNFDPALMYNSQTIAESLNKSESNGRFSYHEQPSIFGPAGIGAISGNWQTNWSHDQDGPPPFTETQKITDLAFAGSVGPQQGVHTVGFRRAKYTPSEWHESNYAKYFQCFTDRDKAERVRHEADRAVKETEENSYQPQLKSTQLLKERLHDICFWKHELEREIKDVIEETDFLVAQKRRLETALRNTEIPLHIATDNLNCRRRRQGVDLVEDNVELSLLKEVEIINNVQDLLRKTIQEAEKQIRANRDAKRNLEMDWSDKKEAEELDAKAANLRNAYTNKQFHAGVATFQQIQSSPESWAQFSHDNIVHAEHQRMASIQLRTLIDNVLDDTSRDMREQCDIVNSALQKRIAEAEDAKAKLEENLRKVVADMTKQEKLIDHLKQALFAKSDNLKVSTSRLYIREGRPNVELCRDDAQYHLIGEVNEIQASIDKLLQQINEATKNLKDLTDDRLQLEREISNKKNSLFIDREKCLTHRNRYPSTLRLQGYNEN